MKILPFRSSKLASLGVELEYQIINPITYDTISRAKELMHNLSESPLKKRIKPEITQSMIEINSSIHSSPNDLYQEFLSIRQFLLKQAKQLNICFSGGGTHPFQKWMAGKIFPSKRFKNKSRQFRYLSKQSTVFGQHIHVGCESGEDALYLTHALARYVPHLIAMSASSPFYQGVDTGFQSSRLNFFNAFPFSGVIPCLTNWREFSDYFYKMRKLKLIETMKDFYWDIRPKPEFGTVEVRVCDTPLTLKKAVINAAFLQTLSHHLLKNRPLVVPTPDLYHLYSWNRFQASRYGFDGEIIDPVTLQHITIRDDILETIELIKSSTTHLKNTKWIEHLKQQTILSQNDSNLLHEIFKKVGTLPKVVHEQCLIWAKED